MVPELCRSVFAASVGMGLRRTDSGHVRGAGRVATPCLLAPFRSRVLPTRVVNRRRLTAPKLPCVWSAYRLSSEFTPEALATMLEGSFTHPSLLQAGFRAERQEDGAIWSIEVIDAAGRCFDTIDFPEDRVLTERAFTDEGAAAVILELLRVHYAIASS